MLNQDNQISQNGDNVDHHDSSSQSSLPFGHPTQFVVENVDNDIFSRDEDEQQIEQSEGSNIYHKRYSEKEQIDASQQIIELEKELDEIRERKERIGARNSMFGLNEGPDVFRVKFQDENQQEDDDDLEFFMQIQHRGKSFVPMSSFAQNRVEINAEIENTQESIPVNIEEIELNVSIGPREDINDARNNQSELLDRSLDIEQRLDQTGRFGNDRRDSASKANRKTTLQPYKPEVESDKNQDKEYETAKKTNQDDQQVKPVGYETTRALINIEANTTPKQSPKRSEGLNESPKVVKETKIQIQAQTQQELPIIKNQMEQLSYSQLINHLKMFNPLDKETGRTFSICTKITTIDYYHKLFNPLYQCCGLCATNMTWKMTDNRRSTLASFRRQQQLAESSDKIKPGDILGEERSELPEHIELAIQVGEASIIYLQTLKTLAIAFMILSLLNFPILMTYLSNGYSHKLVSWHENNFLSFLTFGTVGSDSYGCESQDLEIQKYVQNQRIQVCPIIEVFQSNQTSDFTSENTSENQTVIDIPKINEIPDVILPFFLPPIPKLKKMRLKCNDNSKILKFNDFGFVNKKDLLEMQYYSNVTQICYNIKHSMFTPVTWDLFGNFDQLEEQLNYEQNTDISQNQYNIDDSCNIKNMFQNKNQSQLFKQDLLQNCINQTSCIIDLEKIREQISCECLQKMEQRLINEEIMAVYQCSANTFYFQFTYDFLSNFDRPMDKKRMLVCIVIFDTVTVFILVGFIRKLLEINRDKIKEIQKNVEELKDSSVMLLNIPIDKYSQDLRILKMKIWLQLNKQVESLNGNQNQILDINLSPNKAYHLSFIFKMTEIQHQIQKIETKLERHQSQKNKDKLTVELEILYKKQLSHVTYFQTDLHKRITNKDIFNLIEYKFRSDKLDYAMITLQNPQSVSKLLYEKVFEFDNDDKESKIKLMPAINQESILVKNYAFTNESQYFIYIMELILNLFFLLVIIGFNLWIQFKVNYVESIMEFDHGCNTQIFQKESGLRIFAIEAYENYFQIEQETNDKNYHKFGDINCVCRYIHSNGFNINDFSFDTKDDTKYCQIWLKRNNLYSLCTVVVAMVLVVLNNVISHVFYKIIKSQKLKLKSEESTSIFRTICLYETLNIGLVFYLVSCLSLIFEKMAPSIQEKYFNHTTNFFIEQWFDKYSALIFWTMFLQIFSTNILILGQNTLKTLSRYCCDRRCSCSRRLKKDSDQVKTRHDNQDELNQSYSGYEFPIEKAQARMASILFSIIVFSGQSPIFFYIGFFYFCVTYIVDKIQIVKYAKMTKGLGIELMDQTIKLVILGFIIRLIVGLFQLNNFHLLRNLDEQNKKDTNSQRLIGLDQSEFTPFNIYNSTDYEIMNYQAKNNWNQVHIITFLIQIIFVVMISLTMICKITQCFGHGGYGFYYKQNLEDVEVQNELLKQMSLQGLKDFYVRAQTEYREFRSLFYIDVQVNRINSLHLRKSDLSDEQTYFVKNRERRQKMREKPSELTQQMVLEEMCMMHKVSVEQVKEYEEIQLDKLRTIEKAIQDHYAVYSKALVVQQSKFDGSRKDNILQMSLSQYYNNQNNDQKLELMINNHNNLLELDRFKTMKKYMTYNFRLRGSRNGSGSQSYFVFDNKELILSSLIYHQLHERAEKERKRADSILLQQIKEKEQEIINSIKQRKKKKMIKYDTMRDALQERRISRRQTAVFKDLNQSIREETLAQKMQQNEIQVNSDSLDGLNLSKQYIQHQSTFGVVNRISQNSKITHDSTIPAEDKMISRIRTKTIEEEVPEEQESHSFSHSRQSKQSI